MRYYLFMAFLFVGICHNLNAESALPLVPDPPPECPVVYLPPDIHYATKLIHLYNARVSNPNLMVPNRERLLQDGQRGLQGWLPCVPNLAEFPEYIEYPIYRDSNSNSGLFVIFLPPGESGQIGKLIQELLNRSIQYQCKADNFPIPRPGQVQASDYHEERGSNTAALMAGMLIGISLLLCAQLVHRYKT